MASGESVAAVTSGGIDWTSPVTAEPPTMKRATYEDVLNAPENKVAEILDGELVLSPRPAPRHSVAQSSLGMMLGTPFHQGQGGPGGWWILDEPELHFGDQVLVPDLAGWRRERLPAIPEEAFFTLAPDWVCEVLSPSTAEDRPQPQAPDLRRGGSRARLARRSHRAHARGAAPQGRCVDDRRCLCRLGRRADPSVRGDPDRAGAALAGRATGGADACASRRSLSASILRQMKRATYEDVLNAPENKVAEILDGELVLSPRPTPRHSVASSRLGGVLGPFDDGPGGPGGWWILDQPELHSGEQVVVPDLAGWRRERLPVVPEEAYFALAPIGSARCSRLPRRRTIAAASCGSTPRPGWPTPGSSIPSSERSRCCA